MVQHQTIGFVLIDVRPGRYGDALLERRRAIVEFLVPCRDIDLVIERIHLISHLLKLFSQRLTTNGMADLPALDSYLSRRQLRAQRRRRGCHLRVDISFQERSVPHRFHDLLHLLHSLAYGLFRRHFDRCRSLSLTQNSIFYKR